MVDKYMKRCSTSLDIKEIQIRTTTRYPFMPTRIVVIKKKKKKRQVITSVGENVENLVGCTMVSCLGNQARGSLGDKTWSYHVTQQLHSWLCILRKLKHIQTKNCARMFIAAFFLRGSKWKQPKCLSASEPDK